MDLSPHPPSSRFEIAKHVDVSKLLNDLAKKNNKMSEWTFESETLTETATTANSR